MMVPVQPGSNVAEVRDVTQFSEPKNLDILFIDDNEDMLELMRLLLEPQGHVVRTELAGEAGIRSATADPPDVLLSDLGLPDISGCDVARRLRANASTQSIRLIAVSGYSGEEVRERAEKAGFEELVCKPLCGQALQELLKRYG